LLLHPDNPLAFEAKRDDDATLGQGRVTFADHPYRAAFGLRRLPAQLAPQVPEALGLQFRDDFLGALHGLAKGLVGGVGCQYRAKAGGIRIQDGAQQASCRGQVDSTDISHAVSGT
jgi:hypothetical protein